MKVLVRIDHEARRAEVLHHVLDDRRPVAPPGAEIQGGGAIIAGLHDHQGRLLREIAFPAQSYTYLDKPGSFGDLAGKVVRVTDDVRELHLPNLDRLAHVSLERRWAEAGGRGPRTLLKLLRVGDASALRPSRWLDDAQPAEILSPSPLESAVLGAEVVPLHNVEADPSKCYNIVILGDGFQDSELALFKMRARLLAKGMMKQRPFSALKGQIKVQAVAIASPHSGVDHCPFKGVIKDTHFDIEGHFQNAGYPAYFGTKSFRKIEEAAELAVSEGLVDLKIVLVNSIMYGGRGDPETRTVYLPTLIDPAEFVNVALHECGHAIAELADEYIGEEPPPDAKKYPNLATELDRLQGSVSWEHLAFGFERDGAGFRAVHRLGDPIDPTTRRPVMPAALNGMVGLFWGCSFIDPAPPTGIDGAGNSYTDARGGSFYRPMAVCKMRWTIEPFCRVCEHAIRSRIESILALRGAPWR